MTSTEVVVISPFRRPDFRHAVSPTHPYEEPWDSPVFIAAGACEEAGFETTVLVLQNIYAGFDVDSDIDEVREMLKIHQAKLFLFVSDNFIASRSTATTFGIDIVSRLIRETNAGVQIGVCGRLATTTRERLLEVLPLIDFVVIGEFEQVLSEVTTGAMRDPVQLDKMQSVITRRSIETATDVEPAFLLDPDAAALPAFHLAGESVELLARRRNFPDSPIPFSIRTSFGCKFRCRFCAGVPHWKDYRTKSGARIAQEIDNLFAALPGKARISFLEDEIATRHLDHVRTFVNVLKARNIRLDGLYTHATLLTEEIAELLIPVVDRVFLGLDNPQDDILRQMGKGQRLDTVLSAVRRARSVGLGVHLEWIIGSPLETPDSLITSLNSIFTLITTTAVDSVNTYVYCPHPGTEYAKNADAYGLKIHEEFDMLESGGYPAASTKSLSRQQIYVAYLISQLIISEAHTARILFGRGGVPRPPARAELRRLFEMTSR
jgi:radical SAM superfamily enzyme YgiQ (UPF0313 family)